MRIGVIKSTTIRRRVWPYFAVEIKGLHPTKYYTMQMEVVLADNCRYEYCGRTERWHIVARANNQALYSTVTHYKSPRSGSWWMQSPVSFKEVTFCKITGEHCQTMPTGTKYYDPVLLHSGHKYTFSA